MPGGTNPGLCVWVQERAHICAVAVICFTAWVDVTAHSTSASRGKPSMADEEPTGSTAPWSTHSSSAPQLAVLGGGCRSENPLTVADEPGLVQRHGGRHINTELCTARHVQGLWGLLFPLGGLGGCFLGILLTPLNCFLQLQNQQHCSETVLLVSFPLKLIVSTAKISRQGGF